MVFQNPASAFNPVFPLGDPDAARALAAHERLPKMEAERADP